MQSSGTVEQQAQGNSKQHAGAQVSAHDAKYDRQLRLWGAKGQQRLEQSSLLVFGSSALACELIKNLVLPNLTRVTLVDDHQVNIGDVGNNWFLRHEDIGRSRAECVCTAMRDMNTEFAGQTLAAATAAAADKKQSPAVFLQHQSDTELTQYITQHQCVIVACHLPNRSLLRLAELCNRLCVPLVYARSIGLLGSVRLQLPIGAPHCVIESHPTNDRRCVYIHPSQLQHWPELQSYCDSFRLDSLDAEQHAHVPWLVILVQCSALWRQSHNNTLPESYTERQEFKQFISAQSRDATELNFSEAQENAHRLYAQPLLDAQTQSVLDDTQNQNVALHRCSQATDASQLRAALSIEHVRFFILVCALRRFIASPRGGNGTMLPVSSDLPDMHSLTEWYVRIKTIFAERAEADAKAVHQMMCELLVEHCKLPLATVQECAPSLADVVHFCKHCRELRVCTTSLLSQEYDAASFPSEQLNELLEDDGAEVDEATEAESSEQADAESAGAASHMPPRIHPLAYYFALRSIDDFHDASLRYPGDISAHVNIDRLSLEKIIKQMLVDCKVNAKLLSYDSRIAGECVRYAGREVHNTSALIGGVAAQLVLKLLMHQYVPLNNTFVFDGITCTAKTMQL